ncbi:MAG: hypothetical protein HC804_12290 [Anaerolineae bacterium]|nr:hypothetical protein [Anaerolineae bacterium]
MADSGGAVTAVSIAGVGEISKSCTGGSAVGVGEMVGGTAVTTWATFATATADWLWQAASKPMMKSDTKT